MSDDRKEHLVRYTRETPPTESQTDWERVRKLTDAEIEAAIRGDPDAVSLLAWDYRLVHTTANGVDCYAIYECYYTAEGDYITRTAEPSYPAGETLDELREDLAAYLRALELPIIDEPASAAQQDAEPPTRS